MPLGFGPHGGEILVADEDGMLSTQSRTLIHRSRSLHRFSKYPLSR